MPRRACRRLARLAAHVASSTEAGVATALPDTTTTERSAELHAESAKYLPLGVSSQFRRDVTEVPRFYERAEGHYHYDVDGNKLLDYGLAFGPLILGSNHPAINAAVTEKVTQLYGIGAGHEDEVKLARLMTEVLGTGVDNVLFSNTGTEAVQTAIKLARATTGRSKIVKFEGHYHGWANNVLVSVHQPPEDMGEATGVMPTLPEAGGNPDSEHSEILTLPWNRLDLLEELLASRGDEIAAVICEPINGNSGCLMPAEGFLAGMVELCAKFGAKSIFDEVITGFRIALGGAREFFGVIPDLSTHAKAMAGGFAMSAVAGKKEMFDCLRDVCPLTLFASSPPAADWPLRLCCLCRASPRMRGPTTGKPSTSPRRWPPWRPCPRTASTPAPWPTARPCARRSSARRIVTASMLARRVSARCSACTSGLPSRRRTTGRWRGRTRSSTKSSAPPCSVRILPTYPTATCPALTRD
eukprot:COSAG04_NODE_357_length_16031_cov_6.453427_8_plen_470_part_00